MEPAISYWNGACQFANDDLDLRAIKPKAFSWIILRHHVEQECKVFFHRAGKRYAFSLTEQPDT